MDILPGFPPRSHNSGRRAAAPQTIRCHRGSTTGARIPVSLPCITDRSSTHPVPVLPNLQPKRQTPQSTSMNCGAQLLSRRRPTLPPSCPGSTMGAGGLNDRVRNGNGCSPTAIATGKTFLDRECKGNQGHQIRKPLEIRFKNYIREERKFESKEALIEQIKNDIEKCKTY